jgi:hypothetical protein
MKAIAILKEEIKRLAEQGRSIVKDIHASSGMDRYWAWSAKRAVGTEARYALLAYACLRGIPYERVEAPSRKGNEPSATRVFEVLSKALDEDVKAAWSPEPVRAWLVRRPRGEEAQAA